MITEKEIYNYRKELENKATIRQRQAADPQLSIWVNASAGTGKTKVLTDRVLRLLLSGINAGKLLCLTYTKAAAVEMNSRLSKKLSQWAIADDDTLEQELIKLYGILPKNEKQTENLKIKARKLFAVTLDTPGGIKIQTIHSFCQEILKRFPIEAGISPYFEVMDNRAEHEAIEEIKKQLIEKINNQSETYLAQAVSFLTANINETKFPGIIDQIIKNRSKIERLFRKYETVDEIIENQAQKLGINPNKTDEDMIHDFFDKLPKTDLKILLEAWKNSGSKYEERKRRLAFALENQQTVDFKNYQRAFLKETGDEYTTIAASSLVKKNPRLKEIFITEASRVLELKEKLKAYRVFLSTKAIDILAGELIRCYNQYKQNHALMDYNDMIILTRRLLENTDTARWVLYKLDGGIDCILIDEAQDTSPDQWEIIRAISDEFFSEENNNRTIFAVGDRKQSIYSFQGADPDKFDEMCQYFADKTSKFQKIDMQVSFRSTGAVLDAVNHLFSNPQVSSGVVSVGENILHIPSRQGEWGCVELWPLTEPEKGENIDEWQPPVEQEIAPTTSLRMARFIAQKIHSMVNNKEILISQNRPIQYGDFLILVRRRDAFCEEFIRECKKVNVQIAGIDRIQLLEQIAVQDMISLGKFLLLPEDDLSLAEVLKSPLFGLNDHDLFQLCYQRHNSLWHTLEKSANYKTITQTLKHLLNMVDYARPFELYGEVLHVLHGQQLFAERMGKEAEDGLNEFLNLTLLFEQNHIASLQKFINWFTKDDVEIKRESETENTNLVRLMTVHGSKGLQAPIVILPDTVREPQYSRKAEILWDHDELFFYPSCADDYEKICNNLNNKQKQKIIEEYKRLLYVALTRAEDKLVICGYYKSRKPDQNSWYNLFQNSFQDISEEQNNEEQNFRQHISPQILTTKTNKKQDDDKIIFTPQEWMKKNAPIEQPLARPLTPSKQEEDNQPIFSPLCNNDNSHIFKRGILIHRLLQFLPQITKTKQKEFAEKFLLYQAPEIDNYNKNKIISEVLSLLDNPEFGSVFGPYSKAEVPIMGKVDNKIISGQIDRLIVEENRVVIVDFKTNRPAAQNQQQIPEIYRKQLSAYRRLLSEIYPNKKIVSLILWTNTAQLMSVE